MGLRIKKYKDGYRSHWYAYYSDHNQKQEIRLDERIAGTPPSSLSVKDRGDAAFERSRDRAQAKLDEILASLRQKGASEAIMERLIESKTGIKPTYHRLDQLAALWNGIGRAKELSDGRKAANTFVANEFAAFCKKTYLYEVTEADAERYFRWINGKLAWSTVLSHMSFLSGAFTRFLPTGSHNPFKSIMKRNGTKEAATIHHEPLTDDELRKVYAAARDDEFLYPLVVCAACTGARLKDICNLQWINIDFRDGIVSFNAAKTGSRCEVPLFPEFRKICEERWEKREPGEIYVFPEAANMYKYNRSGLVKRGKMLFAKALFFNGPETQEDVTEVVDGVPAAPKTPSDILHMIESMPGSDKARSKARGLYERYAIQMQSIRKIEAETGIPKNTVSDTLKRIERHVGERIIRFDRSAPRPRHFLRQTRLSRSDNRRAVSIYGWHSFRTTFCVQAILHHIPESMIIKAVGHSTFKTTNEYYNNPKRASIKEVWMKALGSTAIGTTQTPLIQNTITIQP